MELAGRVAIVTGGGTGIGRATCIRLARAGAKAVLINYSRSAAEAESTSEELRGLGTEGVAHRADVADESMVKAMVASTVERWGRLDVLVNSVSPGLVSTRWFSKSFGDEAAAAQEDVFAKATPLRKIATPDDVAQAVIALLENDLITGQDLVIDGGKNVLYQPLA